MKQGPIVIIDDDRDDHQFMADAFNELKISNELYFFLTTAEAMAFLTSTSQQPFIIFCDINMPKENGLTFKQRIDANPMLRKKSIPFIFYSTSANQHEVIKAYDILTIQGFFVKESKHSMMLDDLHVILKYWSRCRHPNS